MMNTERARIAVETVFGGAGDWLQGGFYVIPVSGDEAEADATAEKIRGRLPAGWVAEWTGSGNGDTSDLRVREVVR